MTQPPPPSTPPGWHRDPDDPTLLRWWDGNQWTDNWELANRPVKTKASVVLPLLIAGGLVIGAVLVVIAIVMVGALESTESDPLPTAGSDTTSRPVNPSATAAASRSAELERQRRDQEFQRLTNKASYRPVSSRDWQLIAKNPDGHIGELYVVYGRVTQADSAMGAYQIRVNTDGQQVESYDYDINTVVDAGLGSFKEVVEDDLVAMWVSVTGSETYDTTMGGSVTAPKVEANIIEVYGSAG
ncbi:DUF2510 domain-containing protein [Gordonia sp. NPDC058843]|uniref:DUF2510 domain-containing protein n=1 Tax=Gordonia sp. NPDC058843 TaxID=3346648 RepID=UPI0036A35DDA